MLSPETRRLMAQTYEGWIKDAATLSRPLETMKWAYQHICLGKDPWTGLGSFSHAWYGYAKEKRTALVAEPLVTPEEETLYTHRWAAFCAASVEFLCDRYTLTCPDWVSDTHYTLQDPWWYTVQANSQVVRERLAQTTPTQFTNRNIFCGNRLFQNKYEMYEWMQEAETKGAAHIHLVFRLICLDRPGKRLHGTLRCACLDPLPKRLRCDSDVI